MAGNITDLVSRVTDSNTGRPIIAQLASPGKAIGASTITLQAATNWTTNSTVYFAIYNTMTVGNVTVKDPSTQTDWKATLSGVTLSNLTLTGGNDRAYTAGAIVELTDTARQAKDDYDWKMSHHNQDGSHKTFTETSVIPTAALQDSSVTTSKLADSSVTSAKLAPTKSTDANGWTVYNYGTWKEYAKAVTFSGTFASQASLVLSSNNLPSDLTQFGSNFIMTTMQLTSGYGYDFTWNLENFTSTSTSLSFSAKCISGSTRTYAGSIHVRIRTA